MNQNLLLPDGGMSTPSLTWKTGTRANAVADHTLIMGVVNVTPDSFSDGGHFLDTERAVAQGCLLSEQGAEILDVGGESTRPGAEPVSEAEEIRRVVPVIRGLRERLPDQLISIDSSKAAVASAALEAGADILNDVTAGRGDPEMFALAAASGAGLVLMHMQGEPRTMQANPCYADVVSEVDEFFKERIQAAEAAGVDPAQIALDPGVGFGKTLEHNLLLIANLSAFLSLGRPLLLGVSRKRWLGEITGREVGDRLAASLGGAAACVANGAHILRVHDVIESCDLVKILDRVRQVHS